MRADFIPFSHNCSHCSTSHPEARASGLRFTAEDAEEPVYRRGRGGRRETLNLFSLCALCGDVLTATIIKNRFTAEDAEDAEKL